MEEVSIDTSTAPETNFTTFREVINRWNRLTKGKSKTKSGALLRYVFWGLFEQFRSVAVLALYLMLFQWIVLQTPIDELFAVLLGLGAIIVGLFLFLEGLTLGIMPLGRLMGQELPKKFGLPVVLGLILLLGILVTFAEPAISSLQTIGENLDKGEYKNVYTLLHNPWNFVMILTVGVGVGGASMVGIWRLVKRYNISRFILSILLPVVLSGIGLHIEGENASTALSWDCGAITTGPVTVPLVLALGIGVSQTIHSKPVKNPDFAEGEEGEELEEIDDNDKTSKDDGGFGVVTLASLYPVLTVQLLSYFLITQEQANQTDTEPEQISWYETTPWTEIVLGLRAVVPLVLFVVFVVKVLLRENLPRVYLSKLLIEANFLENPDDTIQDIELEELGEEEDFSEHLEPHVPDVFLLSHRREEPSLLFVGLFLTLIGMIVFNFGLSFGLGKLGSQTGSLLPIAFTTIDSINTEPLYSYSVGVCLVIMFAFFLGILATMAEPALSVMGTQVEILTKGSFKKLYLIFAVSIGVASGLAFGVIKVIYQIPLLYFLYPAYTVATVITLLSEETFRCIAWDSAGVTTGPVTVPLVLSLGVALGSSVKSDGFGLLALASAGPILSVLIAGLMVKSANYVSTSIRSRNSYNANALAGRELEIDE